MIKARLLAIVSWAAVLLLVLGVAIAWVGPERLVAPWLSIDTMALLVALALMLASYLISHLAHHPLFPGPACRSFLVGLPPVELAQPDGDAFR